MKGQDNMNKINNYKSKYSKATLKRNYFLKVNFQGYDRKRRFYEKLKEFGTDFNNIPNDLIAVIFMLSSYRFTWFNVKKYIHFSGIDFEKFNLIESDPRDYLIYKAAEDIYNRKENIKIYDLTDRSLCSDKTSKLICDSIMLSRHGLKIL